MPLARLRRWCAAHVACVLRRRVCHVTDPLPCRSANHDHDHASHSCTADCGWITGHSYVTYGPLLCGATQVLFEGIPTWPDAGRMWAIVQKYKVNILYTAPTAIRSLEAFGDSFVTPHDRSSLRILGTVGEPINPQAWSWYHDVR